MYGDKGTIHDYMRGVRLADERLRPRGTFRIIFRSNYQGSAPESSEYRISSHAVRSVLIEGVGIPLRSFDGPVKEE